jgi:transcriptional regulator with XRE-family HTH domain
VEDTLGELGQLLRDAREKKGLSVAEVEEDTKIRQAQIQALEADDHSVFASAIQRKGLLRNYAQYLGLDLSEIATLQDSGEARTNPVPVVSAGFEPPRGMAITSWLFIDVFLGILIVASAVLVGSVIYNRWQPTLAESSATPTHRVSMTSPVLQFTPTHTPPPTATPTRVPSGRLQVDVQIIARTWLEVTVDGEPAFRGLIEAGTNWSWFAENSIAMHVGNAGGVVVTLNGQDLGPLGEENQVVDIEWTWEKLNATPEPVPVSGTPVITGTVVLTPSPAP